MSEPLRFYTLTDLLDHSGNGGAALTNNGAVGIGANGATFSGSDYLDTTEVLIGGKTALTLIAQVRVSGAVGSKAILGQLALFFGTDTDGGNHVFAVLVTTNQGAVLSDNSYAFSSDQNWHLIGLQFDGITLKTRLDGAPWAGTASATGAVVTNAGNFNVGTDALNAQPWVGGGKNVRVYTRTVTDEEWLSFLDQSNSDYLNLLAVNTTSGAKFTFTAGIATGQNGWYPDGAGVYVYCWTRDFAMMVRGCAQGTFSASDIYNIITLFCSHQREDGLFVDAVGPDDSIFQSFGGPLRTLDNGCEIVDLCYNHYLATGVTTAYTAFKTNIANYLAALPVQNHLVWLDPSNNSSFLIAWGFEDSVVSRGYEVNMSVLRYRAFAQLARMAIAAGDNDIYSAELPLIKTAMESYLWDASAGWFRNASVKCMQHCVPGSIYAVVVGACSSAIANIIAQTLYNSRPGRSLDIAGKGCWQNGQLRHMPADEFWEDTNQAGPPGTYQNGAYWSTFSGWACYVLSLYNGEEALLARRELAAQFQVTDPTKTPYEAANTAIPYNGAANYCASAALPLQSDRFLNAGIPFEDSFHIGDLNALISSGFFV